MWNRWLIVAALLYCAVSLSSADESETRLNAAAAALADAQWGPDLKSSVKDVTKRIKEQDKSEKKELKGEKKEQDIRSGADETWNAAQQAETEFVGARDEALHADQDGGTAAEGTQADAGAAEAEQHGAAGSNEMAKIEQQQEAEVKQEENDSEQRLVGIEEKGQRSLEKTQEALNEIKATGTVHLRRRGDEKARIMAQDDMAFAKQIARQQTEHEWRLEQRAQRTEARLDRMLQETRALLKKRDEADEARAAALESRLDAQARDAEMRLVRRQRKAALMRLAKLRLAEQELNTQRARAQHERGQLELRPRILNARLEHVAGTAVRQRLARAMRVADAARHQAALQAERYELLRAARRGALQASGVGADVRVRSSGALAGAFDNGGGGGGGGSGGRDDALRGQEVPLRMVPPQHA